MLPLVTGAIHAFGVMLALPMGAVDHRIHARLLDLSTVGGYSQFLGYLGRLKSIFLSYGVLLFLRLLKLAEPIFHQADGDFCAIFREVKPGSSVVLGFS